MNIEEFKNLSFEEKTNVVREACYNTYGDALNLIMSNETVPICFPKESLRTIGFQGRLNLAIKDLHDLKIIRYHPKYTGGYYHCYQGTNTLEWEKICQALYPNSPNAYLHINRFHSFPFPESYTLESFKEFGKKIKNWETSKNGNS